MPYKGKLTVDIVGSTNIVVAPFGYTCTIDGITYDIDIPYGFSTDFASIPRPARILITGHDRTRWGATIHDLLYDADEEYREMHGINRKIADQIFYEAMKESGVGSIKRRVMYAAVRIGAGPSW